MTRGGTKWLSSQTARITKVATVPKASLSRQRDFDG